MAEAGGTCIIDEFDEPQYDSKGTLVGPPMEFIPASGVNEDEGLSAVNDLLDWNQEQPMMPVLNAPRLFVCEDAMQVIWTLENFTGRGGAKGACKDFADLLRYMALAKLSHVDTVLGAWTGRGRVVAHESHEWTRILNSSFQRGRRGRCGTPRWDGIIGGTGRRQWWTMPPEDYDAQTCLEARLLPWGVYFGKNAKKGILT